jgi:serine/threonine protein kinase
MQSGERITINGRSYRLGSLLSTSAGSYGQVWAATDPAGRGVALKFINTEAMSRVDPALHGHWRAHLEREIAFLDGLDADQSRHIVTLLDHGQANGQPVLVMERLHANLGQWLAQQRRESELPPELERVIDWTGQILEGLEAIHRAGFVYRDLKFSNILIDEGGSLLKLADFGSLSRVDGDNTCSFVGTPATMAPEQVLPVRQGAAGSEYAIDYRADYYALGLLLFALLTDRPTTSAQRRLGQLLALHGQEGAGRQREQLGGLDEEERELLRWSIEFWTVPALPEQARSGAAVLLTDLIDRLLARDPAARPVHGAEIRAVLAAVRVNPPSIVADGPVVSEPPPTAPPNRRPSRSNGAARSSPVWLRRAVGLAGMSGLAGALAWAIFIQPAVDWLPIFSEPPSLTLPAPNVAPIAETESTPVGEPAVATVTTPETESAPVEPEPVQVEEPTVATVATPEAEPAPEPETAAPAIIVAPPPAKPPVAKTPVATPTSPAAAPVAAERSAPKHPRIPAPTATTVRPAPAARPASPPRVAKPAPKASPAPAAGAPRGSPSTARATPAPRSAGTAPATARATRPAPAATQPAAASPVARAAPPAPPALPSIELTSRPQSPPALPPIELTSRPQSPPRIELIGRPTPPAAQPQSRPSSASPASRPPARSSAPVTNRNLDVDRLAAGVRREAEAFTEWVSRTSTTISSEVQRGLESANQALNPRARGNNTHIERRDQQYRRRADESPLPRSPEPYR